jgi:5-formyltetrahydrofolate cyclo-ligase
MKPDLRSQARTRRKSVQPSADKGQAITRHFFDNIPIKQSDILSAYWPMGSEISPLPIIAEAKKRTLTITLPVVEEDHKILSFSEFNQTDGTLTGIMHTPDILIVPLLAFDAKGHRLGQGGGYYDATLEHLRAQKEILAVGLAYAEQEWLHDLPAEEHDQKLDWIITPSEARKF